MRLTFAEDRMKVLKHLMTMKMMTTKEGLMMLQHNKIITCIFDIMCVLCFKVISSFFLHVNCQRIFTMHGETNKHNKSKNRFFVNTYQFLIKIIICEYWFSTTPRSLVIRPPTGDVYYDNGTMTNDYNYDDFTNILFTQPLHWK